MLKAGVPPLKSKSATSVKQALEVAEEIGYPVIVRVAYTLGGKGAGVAHNAEELKEIATRGISPEPNQPNPNRRVRWALERS